MFANRRKRRPHGSCVTLFRTVVPCAAASSPPLSCVLLAACAPAAMHAPADSAPTPSTATANTHATFKEASPSPTSRATRPLPAQPPSEPAPPPPPLPTAPPTRFVPRTATINVSGDLLWHNSLWTSAARDARFTGEAEFDFAPQLASLEPYVSAADLAICHSEVPFAPAGGPYQNYPLFAAPQEAALGAGRPGAHRAGAPRRGDPELLGRSPPRKRQRPLSSSPQTVGSGSR